MIVSGLKAYSSKKGKSPGTYDSFFPSGSSPPSAFSESAARKLSAVDRCVELISDSMGKLPYFLMDGETKKRMRDPVLSILNVRPNEAMTPFVAKKLVETNRLFHGNGYEWIVRNPRTGLVEELIPIPSYLVQPWVSQGGELRYMVSHPYTMDPMILPQSDVCHYKGPSRDGIRGIGVLTRGSDVISAGLSHQEYERSFYENGCSPAGILRTDSDLNGYVKDPKNPGKRIYAKDAIRAEWEKIHMGPKNSHRTAILDCGTDYKPISISNQDAQFVESKEISIRDLARFFGVPLYKLQEGKQAYGSNEQNAIEYVVGTLHPIVTQYEEERTWKLLTKSQVDAGLELRINLMAELRGDTNARGEWYKVMCEIGAFSIDTVLDLEDLPAVPGGDARRASLNYVPLDLWRELSRMRAGGKEE